MLTDADGPYSGRGTCKQQITNLQSHKTTDIGYYIIYLEKHVCRIATLYFTTVYIEMEI